MNKNEGIKAGIAVTRFRYEGQVFNQIHITYAGMNIPLFLPEKMLELGHALHTKKDLRGIAISVSCAGSDYLTKELLVPITPGPDPKLFCKTMIWEPHFNVDEAIKWIREALLEISN